ncbi:MAG: UvrB/UvrC motif-containing protein [Hungatella hathewayi]|nr:UvrB/UvrC motif-containing protein [Hungatella hathewayi]
MLCERCKIREANIQYTEVINGVKTEHHFCAQCAKEMDFGAYSAIFDGEFPLAKLLSGLLGAETPTERQDKRQKIVCPTCGLSYEEFVKDSCFGCADCYGVFDVLINENIKQLQGSDCHKGKRPVYQRGSVPEDRMEETAGVHSSVEEELRSLEIRLRDAIRLEEYEIAAQCRDRIRELKQTVDTHENTEKGEETNA